MSEIPGGLRYTEEHEYLKARDEDGIYQVGITDYAQGELGDVVFIELPEVGASFDKVACGWRKPHPSGARDDG